MRNVQSRIFLPVLLSVAFHIALVGGLLWGYSEELADFLQPKQAAAAPQNAIDLPDPQRADKMGEMFGKGHAVNTSPGELPSLARFANQQQADLSRDPQGQGRIGDPPSRQLMPPAKMQILAPAEPLGVFGMPADAALPPPPARPRPLPDALIARHRPGPPPQPLESPPATMPVSSQTTSLADASAASGSPTPHPSASTADPLPESDSESDAFSDVGSVVVQSGRVEARFGRKVKTTRPRIKFAGTFDMMSLDYPTVVMKVKTDATGKVTSVNILRSSGSVDLDHPTEMAIYDWWIEPPKDKAGHPLPDVMVWKIAFR